MKPRLTYNLCMAAGQDAGNKNMREHGRRVWSIEDWNTASEISNELLNKMDDEGGQDAI